MKKGQEGYALVAVLIATTILLTISSLGLSQLKAATRLSRYDRLTTDADYQAVSGINRAWAEVVTTGYNPSLSGSVGCAGLGQPADAAAVFQPDTALDLRHRVWIYRAPRLCPDPTEKVDVEIARPRETPPAGYYHFVFTWHDADYKETAPSPIATLEVKANEAPLVLTPDYDDGTYYSKPDLAEGHYVYYALTTATAQPPPLSEFRRLIIRDDTVRCGFRNLFRCVKQAPGISNNEIPPSSNETLSFQLISTGWAQAINGTASRRTIRGSMLPGDETIEYDYDW